MYFDYKARPDFYNKPVTPKGHIQEFIEHGIVMLSITYSCFYFIDWFFFGHI